MEAAWKVRGEVLKGSQQKYDGSYDESYDKRRNAPQKKNM
jgi:hypothetical protein